MGLRRTRRTVPACPSRLESVERNQSRVYFTPYAPSVRTPVPGAKANAMIYSEKRGENGVNSGVYEAAAFCPESAAASAACAALQSYTVNVFASDSYKADRSITIARPLALLEIYSETRHVRALIHHARSACQLGSGTIDTSDRLRCRG